MEVETCIICYELLNEINQIESECCGKEIHVRCLHQWLFQNKNTKCPFCRHTFTPEYRYILSEAYLADDWPMPRLMRLLNWDETKINLLKVSDTNYQVISRGQVVIFQTSELKYTYYPVSHCYRVHLSSTELQKLTNIIEKVIQLALDHELIDDREDTITLEPLLIQEHHHDLDEIEILTRKPEPIRGTQKFEFLIKLEVNDSRYPKLTFSQIGSQIPTDTKVENHINWTSLNLSGVNDDCLYQPPVRGLPAKYGKIC